MACNVYKEEETEKVLSDILDLTKKSLETDHNQMEKEIELFIKQNIEEMHLSMRELRDSLVKEAKLMEGNL